jgi:hypothetical protein
MNPTIKNLLEQTGFVFWSDYENDAKNSDNIDWANDYDSELQDFVYELVEHMCETVEQNGFLHGPELADLLRDRYTP